MLPLRDILERMRREWDERAVENVRRYVASVDWQSEEVFDASGRRDTEILMRRLPWSDTKDMIILDIGCGIGRMEKFLSPLFKEVYGVDVSKEMIKRGKKQLKNCKNVIFQNCNGKDLKMFEDNMFDFVFSYTTFQHVPGYIVWSYCKEAYRVLKPDGVFKFQVFEKTLSLRKAVAYLIRGDVQRALRNLLLISDSDNFWVVETWPKGKDYSRGEIREKLCSLGFIDIGFSENLIKDKYRMLWVTCRKPSKASPEY